MTLSLDTYISFTRYFATFVLSFFTYQFILGVINYQNHRIKSSIWHILMCFSTALYCFVFTFNTHFFNQDLSNNLLSIFWVLAYGSFFCYLKAIEVFLDKEIKLLNFSKFYCLLLSGLQLINFFSSVFFKKNFLFKTNVAQETLFAKTMSFTVSPDIGALSLGSLGVIVVIYSGIVIWRELNKTGNKELMLKAGILVTILCVLNDSALGLELSGSLIPLYYLGNAFEAFRLNLFYQRKANEKIHALEHEVDELSKVAQFGFAAASISHDIRNYLMIVKTSLNKANQGVNTEDNVKKALKYITQTSDITKIYMDLFKHNEDLNLSEHSLPHIVHDAIEILQDKITKAKINIDIQVREEKIISCNKIAFTLCLINLLGNAIDEISNSSDSWIRISFCDKNNSLQIQDSGLGIPKDIAKNIFSPNYSTKKKTGGSGLGLAISKHILDKTGFGLKLDQTQTNTTFVIDF